MDRVVPSRLSPILFILPLLAEPPAWSSAVGGNGRFPQKARTGGSSLVAEAEAEAGISRRRRRSTAFEARGGLRASGRRQRQGQGAAEARWRPARVWETSAVVGRLSYGKEPASVAWLEATRDAGRGTEVVGDGLEAEARPGGGGRQPGGGGRGRRRAHAGEVRL